MHVSHCLHRARSVITACGLLVPACDANQPGKREREIEREREGERRGQVRLTTVSKSKCARCRGGRAAEVAPPHTAGDAGSPLCGDREARVVITGW